ncbi:cystathionine gamma-synthase family protein [Govanella unica]|uniref:Cystathionine gamma-synthase family protein n=1 Tax=Govanella unica TaxID=2975056 RepID=A0A9X3Z7G7_9PROT|nr:cystathionine gamma-synthase family protein [Govania unica]MDA5194043.1 cystathionine gamma-synthase family protein [Govania unica]
MKLTKSYHHRTLGNHPLHPETLMMSYGYDPKFSEGAIKAPLFQTSTFVFENAAAGKSFFELAYGKRQRGPAEDPGMIYSRINNPDLEILEDRLTLWDDAQDGLVFSSGMAAITTSLLSFLRPGDVVMHSEPIYGGSDFLLHKILPQFGIHYVGFPADASGDEIEARMRQAEDMGPVRVIYLETPANPTNKLADIAACATVRDAALARTGTRAVIMVDNTYLGPLWQHPLKHGADIVLYSLTKYVGGHSDVIAGAALGSAELITLVRGFRTILGTMCDPHTGWLLMRSLETLSLRMTRAADNARVVADRLGRHPKVTAVHALDRLDPKSAQGQLFARQCNGAAGSTFSFEIAGGEAEAFRFLDSLTLIKLAVSLGGTESLASHPATMTHSDLSPENLLRTGITPALIRLSIGIENPADLLVDLEQALAKV